MSESAAPNVLKFARGIAEIEQDEPTEEGLRQLVTVLMSAVEEMDRGVKLMVGIVADHDKRIRALELAQRKADRKNVPAIVNQFGEKVN